MDSSLLTPALGHYSPLHGQSEVAVTPGSRKDGRRAEVQDKGFSFNQVIQNHIIIYTHILLVMLSHTVSHLTATKRKCGL